MRIAGLILAVAGVLFAQQSAGELSVQEKAVKANPQDAEARARLGMAYRDVGRFAEAARALEKSLELNPALPRVPVLLAFVYISSGRYADAAPLLRRAFDADPDVGMRMIVGQRLVECLFTTGGEEEALEVVAKLRRLKPDDPDVLYLASKAYANLWNATVQRLLEQSADSYRAHQILAEVLETQEKFSEAASEYRAVVRLHPRMPAVHYKLAKMLLRADPTPEGERAAMTEFRTELEINPFDVPTHVEIGELELKAGRVEDAHKIFSRAVELQPEHAIAQLGLARALIAVRRYQDALERLDLAHRLSPQNEAILYQKMLALRGLGRQGEARQAQSEFQKLKVEKEQSLTSIRERLKGRAPLATPAP